MLVFGDPICVEDPREVLSRLRRLAAAAAVAREPLERHGAWVTGLIEAGMLAQGLIDARFALSGEDTWDQPELDWVRPFAQAVVRSWRGGFRRSPGISPEEIDRWASRGLPESVRMKVPEGYAFYALYPECYAMAAERLPADAQVVGIRSIGTSLGAIVAAALGQRRYRTVRPVGSPFERTLSLGRAEVLCRAGEAVAIVDEGPGLSGSSLGAVADRVEALGGLSLFLPSHSGPLGAKASARHRERWQRATRHVVGAEAILLEDPRGGLARWIEPLVGRVEAPLEELSGGRWRSLQAGPPAPAVPMRERRKFLARAGGKRWLLKFAGLGGWGEATWERARTLARAGHSPEVAGLCHGFLAQRWCEDAAPLRRGPGPLLRPCLETVGRYLAFRATHLGARRAHAGASIHLLSEMLRRNVALGVGMQAAEALERWRPSLGALEARVCRIETDNRMHPWEWIELEGRWLKTDGVDHAHAHDLVGCQDLGWDLAGARFELGLDPDDCARLDRVVSALGARLPPPDLRAFLERAYLAFQLGAWTMAGDATADPEERQRTDARVGFYRSALSALLAAD